MEEVKLRVGDAKQRDVGRGIARIDQRTMKKLGISAGDVVEIRGKRTTAAVAWLAYSEDQNKDIIKIDSFTRKNAGVAMNEFAVIRPAKLENAKRIIIAPVDMRLNVDKDFTNFVKNRLMERTFVEGDSTLVLMLGHAMPFQVARTIPRDVPVQITSDTVLTVLNEPLPPAPKRKLELETPADIRYLLRYDWLHNLGTIIKATKIVFSIPDRKIRDTEEEKVVRAAAKIADEKLSNVRIEVSFEMNGTTIGTLPWAQVDMYGRVSSIYPDIPLPLPSPSITPQRPYERVTAPMKRCFKTGVKSCPKKINFSPRSVVVAMPFTDEFSDAYKYAIRPALEEADFKPWKADEQISNIDIMCKICHAIQESGYLLANITTWNANVVFELGLAYGLARNVILIKHKKAEVPVDLKGLEYIEYGTIDELKRNLLLFLKGATTTE